MKKLFFSGLFLTILVGSACKKQLSETFSETSNKSLVLVDKVEFEGDTIYYEYFLENRRVLNPNYDLNDDGYLNIVEGKIDTIMNKKTIAIHTFSSDFEYKKFTKELDLNFAKIDLFESLIHDFILNNPELIRNCEEEKGDCDIYMNYQDSVFSEIFGDDIRSKAPTVIHDKTTGGSPAWTMIIPTVPTMAPGWNNRTSSINNLNIISFVNLYDNTFFRKRIATFIGFQGWQVIPFIGGLSFIDNKTSSALH